MLNPLRPLFNVCNAIVVYCNQTVIFYSATSVDMIFVSRTVPGKTCATVVINTESRLHLRERLFGDKLEKALTTIFEEYSTDVVIKKLAPASNSQRNEALNSVVSTKAPKSRYYGGSESNNFRVACGVGQTNEGSKYMYVPQVIKEIGLKAGEH